VVYSQIPEHGAADGDAILAVAESISDGGEVSNAKHKTNNTLVCVLVAFILKAPGTRGKKLWRRAGRLLRNVSMVLDMCVISLMQLRDEEHDSLPDAQHTHRDDDVFAERVQKLKDGLKRNSSHGLQQDDKKKQWFLRVRPRQSMHVLTCLVIHTALCHMSSGQANMPYVE
jgi:hypothetical protein